MGDDNQEMIDKVRAAIKDRATWFALLYKSFKEALPEQQVEELARKAIYEFGRLKALHPQDRPQAFNFFFVFRHDMKIKPAWVQ